MRRPNLNLFLSPANTARHGLRSHRTWLAGLALLAAMALPAWAPSPAHAAEPPTAPQLRIEAGMHTASIRRIDTDAQGRWAVTASHDKTARVWDVASGRLLQVLRPPLGEGDEGKLYAVALSPDGAVVAAAGWTKLGSETGHTVYLFNRSTGQLLRRLSGLPNVILHLAFSPDGRWLAATLGAGGLRVWRWAESSAPLVDSDYRGDSYAASFALSDAGSNGSGSRNAAPLLLATSSYDGQLRLYRLVPDAAAGSALKPVHTLAAPGGQRPYGLAFSPDGQQLAVGYDDSNRVDVLAAVDPGSSGKPHLALTHTPTSAGVGNGKLVAVAFSANGQTLAAGGTWSASSRSLLRLWPQAGRSQPQDVPTISNTLHGLAPLPSAAGGGWLVGASGPAWGLVRPDGTWQHRGLAPIADLRYSQRSSFQLALSGRAIQFSFGESGKSPHHFDLRQRSLQPGALPGGQPPRTEGQKVEGWEDTTKPTLNGQPLKLDDYENARSLAALPGDQGFALGSDYWLRLHTADGQARWPPRAVPGTVWGVNIPQTGDLAGRIIVAAYGDGTIRWHRVSDGQELLAFFPHADRTRWVLWTPSGYYDASPGGEDLIGWHLNRGADQAADFFPASQFREQFYRPDIIDRVLETLDEAQAVAQANEAAGRREVPVSVAQVLPPVLDLVSAPERFDQTRLPVRIRVRAPADAPAMRLRVLVNGEIMPTARGAKAIHADGSEDLWLNLPPSNSEVLVYADNRHGSSLPLKLSLAWAGEQKAFVPGRQGEQAARKPRLWVLAVGVSKYQDPAVPTLSYAHADAAAFARLMQAQQGKAYEAVTARVLLDAQATRQAVLDGLDWLQTAVRPGDVGMVFLAGHGFTMATDHRYFYGNHDVQLARLTETGVPYKAIQEAMVNFNLRGGGTRAVFFIDTCHAGDASGTRVLGNVKTSNADNLAAELSRQENQVLVFASSKGDQFSIEDARLGHGVFTKALIEGLGDEWRADPFGLGSVTYTGLNAWVSARVPVLSQRRQTPRLLAPPGGVDDFSLATKP